MKTKILLFEPGFSATTSAVLHSQFLQQAAVLTELGAECYFFGADLAENIDSARIEALKLKFNLKECHIYPVPEHGKNWRSLMRATNIAAKGLLDHIERIAPAISYSWHAGPALKLEALGRNLTGKTIFFCQGATSEEVRLKSRRSSGFKSLYIAWRERRLFQRVDHMVVVSESMKKWVARIAPGVSMDVLPCCYDSAKFKPLPEARKKTREDLGWKDDVPVVIYSGGNSYWQRLPDIIKVLASVQQALPELHVIFLSNAEDCIRAALQCAGLNESQWKISSVAHDEVGAWLNAADAGIVLRHDNLVNRVASPIKIGEYLGCSLPVIASNCIGDYSQCIAVANAGIVVDELNLVPDIVEFLKDRSRLEDCASNALKLSSMFSWETGKQTLAEVFGM